MVLDFRKSGAPLTPIPNQGTDFEMLVSYKYIGNPLGQETGVGCRKRIGASSTSWGVSGLLMLSAPYSTCSTSLSLVPFSVQCCGAGIKVGDPNRKLSGRKTLKYWSFNKILWHHFKFETFQINQILQFIIIKLMFPQFSWSVHLHMMVALPEIFLWFEMPKHKHILIKCTENVFVFV